MSNGNEYDENVGTIGNLLKTGKKDIFLVKVPKYIADIWDKAETDTNVAKLTISEFGDGRIEKYSLDLAPEALKLDSMSNIPKKYDIERFDENQQTLGIISEKVSSKKVVNGETIEEKGFSFEGEVLQKLSLRPVINKEYLRVKKNTLNNDLKSNRHLIAIDNKINKFKPMNNIDRNADRKRNRENRDRVLAMLFEAFAKHQYYYLKDLVKITKQPMTFLKTLLTEVGQYNTKNPHKNMWELKAQFKFYGSQGKKDTEVMQWQEAASKIKQGIPNYKQKETKINDDQCDANNEDKDDMIDIDIWFKDNQNKDTEVVQWQEAASKIKQGIPNYNQKETKINIDQCDANNEDKDDMIDIDM